MFEHSIKVPRHYKVAANILKKVSTEGGSVKTLLYDNKLRHFRTNVLFALITEAIKHTTHIDQIFESSGLLTKESRLDPWLAKILTAELLFGKKTLPGKSKPEQTILSYKEHFEKLTAEHEGDMKIEVVRRPRYVRINTNLLTTSDAIRAFQDEGYHFIRCTSGSYNDYLSQIQSLTEYDFTQDYHVKTVFVFAPGTKLHEHELYLENKIILQDKATAMAVHLLAPPPGSTVLDMCAAPGMKTTQLAAYMRNEGKIYAVERNEERYQTLCDFVEKTGSKCVETLHKDSLDIKRGDYDDVEYILLDPSCSGSGMELCVHNYIEDTRLAKLTSLQEKFLKHAMNSFPKAKRIVYSTCSLFPEENERVITNIVKTSRAKWRVQDVKELLKGQWNNFGSGMYGSIGTRCMYAKPDSDFTTGFFLAVLDRDQKDLEKKDKNENNVINGEEKVTKNITNEKYVSNGSNNDIQTKKMKLNEQTVLRNQSEDENSTTPRHKRKKRSSKEADDNSKDEKYNDGSFNIHVEDTASKKIIDENKSNAKKSKKIKRCEISEIFEPEETQNSTMDVEESAILDAETSNRKKKKKKKSKTADDNYVDCRNSGMHVENKASEEINGEDESNVQNSKKIKHREISGNLKLEEIQNSTVDVEESVILDSETIDRKKKKTRKSKAVDDNYFDVGNSNTHVEDRSNKEIIDENKNNGKKSKKIKQCEIIECLKPEEIQNTINNVEELVYVDTDVINKKKKKKKDKRKDGENFDAPIKIDDDEKMVSKKRKRNVSEVPIDNAQVKLQKTKYLEGGEGI